MANRPALLKQSDLTRYIKALRQAGVEGGQVEVRPDGTHVIIILGQGDAAGANPCDRLLKP